MTVYKTSPSRVCNRFNEQRRAISPSIIPHGRKCHLGVFRIRILRRTYSPTHINICATLSNAIRVIHFQTTHLLTHGTRRKGIAPTKKKYNAKLLTIRTKLRSDPGSGRGCLSNFERNIDLYERIYS